ncbi:MAG: galactose-1-phosphate uridylyltransferase [Vicinamibacterales bacterium]
MHSRDFEKPDGRALTLYSRVPIDGDIVAPSPSAGPFQPETHLRWHPLRGEWVAYASHRQMRTFMPPGYNPLAPAVDPAHPTEVPAGNWDIAVFDNLFPALVHDPPPPPEMSVPTAAGAGACEVVVFSQDASASLGTLPLDHVELLIDVWADRYERLGSRSDVAYVFPFENRGAEVGVTLPHPHGQIYAYPFIPPIAARELAQQREYLERTGRGLLADLIQEEVRAQTRLVYRGSSAVAFMPVCARYSYELWVAPERPAESFAALTRIERRDFATALKTVVRTFDALWQRPFPYVLAFHQAPTDGVAHPEAHLHAEFYPAYRMPGRLKYLAGSELGAGVFTADTLPEERVKELQAIARDLDV